MFSIVYTPQNTFPCECKRTDRSTAPASPCVGRPPIDRTVTDGSGHAEPGRSASGQARPLTPSTANRIGALFPCNVVVWEDGPSTQTVYHVSIMKIARLAGMVPDDAAWEEIVAETGALVDEAFADLDTT